MRIGNINKLRLVSGLIRIIKTIIMRNSYLFFLLPIILFMSCRSKSGVSEGKDSLRVPVTVTDTVKPKTDTVRSEAPVVSPARDSVKSVDTTSAGKSATVQAPVVSKEEEKKIRNFLYTAPGTFGWKTKSENIMLDFFRDGRLHIQGPDGEMTLWSGKWSVSGDQVTMVRPDLKKTLKVTAKIEGKNIRLGDKLYTRILYY